MTVNPDVVVVGGGIIGSACARELALTGRKVVVVEPGGSIGQGWQSAAGLLAPQIEAHVDDPMLEIGLAGREYYTAACEALEASTGVNLGLMLGGILQMATSDREAEELREIVAWQRQHGLYCDWLLPEEVKEQSPWLGRCHGALWAPQDGAIDPSRLVQAFIIDGNRLGVRRVEDRATSLEIVNGRVIAVRGRDRYPAQDVVLAAGAWSGRIENLPRPISVEPVRGQMLALPRPRSLPDVVVYGHGHYFLTRGDEVIAGATVEHAGFAADVTGEGLEAIRRAADAICPAILGVPTARSWAGLRPGTPDGLPIIGREPRTEGLWYATGHGRNGVLLAGITGVVLQQLMAGEASLESIPTFRPERFWER